jgi:hypothetical protein
VISFSQDQQRCEELLKVRKKYVAVLDICFRAVLSSSSLDAVLANLPGFGVIKQYLTIDMLECIYRLDRQKISSILGETESFIDKNPWPVESGVRLSYHVIEFLTDKERAGVYYHDPIGAHFLLCHKTISILFPSSWQDIPE